MTEIDYRKRLANLMDATVADHANWTYLAVRPLPVAKRPWKKGEKVVADCSLGVRDLCWFAEAPVDPMRLDWAPYGNSQTLWQHCQHLDSPAELLVGDFVTFGLDGDEHAAMVKRRGKDPLLWSDGHQGAPNFYLLSQDGRVSQYLRNPLPTYEPTAAERLQAMTGFRAWVQWRRGTGDWHGRGKHNRKVRPDVPRRIPASWWRRYARLHLNRKKGNPPTTTP